jgi:uncharacterized membrane protein YccC
MEPELRVSDEDREKAATEIREHYAAGRLDADELGERLDRAYAARTAADLAAVRADLPALPPAKPGRTELQERRAHLSRQLVQSTGAALIPFAVCTLIWLFSGANGGFWPVWTLLIAVIPLARNGWHLYGPAPDLDRVEEELRRGGRGRGLPPPPPPPPP